MVELCAVPIAVVLAEHCNLGVNLLCIVNAVWLLATTHHVSTRPCEASSGNGLHFL